MKILVTGANGMLGYDVCRELARRGATFCGTSSRDFDLTSPNEICSYVMDYAPDAVIHCAAYTAVDRAEDEPGLCRKINTDGTRILANCCQKLHAKMLYISTDYVFPGEGSHPYDTDGETGPLNVYGQTKFEGEEAVRQTLSHYFIVRISWLFGICGKNFVRSMLDLGKKDSEVYITGDQFGSPTYTRDLASLLSDMLETDRYGTYHATNEGFCSWAEFAQEIFNQSGLKISVIPRPASAYPGKALRPHNSRLSKKSLDDAGFVRLPHWKDALSRYLLELEGAG